MWEFLDQLTLFEPGGQITTPLPPKKKFFWKVRRLCLLWFSQFWSHYFLSSDILSVAFGFKEWPIEGFHGCCFLGSTDGNCVQRHLLANSQKTNHNGIFLWNGLCTNKGRQSPLNCINFSWLGDSTFFVRGNWCTYTVLEFPKKSISYLKNKRYEF